MTIVIELKVSALDFATLCVSSVCPKTSNPNEYQSFTPKSGKEDYEEF